MSRKTFVISIIVALILGTGILYFLLGGKAPLVNQIISGSPFGTAPTSTSSNGSSGGNDGTTSTNPDTGIGADGKPLARFFKISDAPVAGAVSINKNGSTYVRYVDRATGHIFDVNTGSLEKSEILNTTLPKIYEALWKADGSGFIAQTIKGEGDVIENTSVKLTPPKATSTTNFYTAEATLLRGSISTIAVNSDGSLLYDMLDTGTMASASFNGEKPKILFTLPFTNWRLVPANSSTALIYTKATNQASGYAYTLNLSTGSLARLAGPLKALTANLAPDGKRLIVGYVNGNTSDFSVINLVSKTTTSLFPITLPEKCVWSRKVSEIIFCGSSISGLTANEPELWYQGLTHFSDQVWKINTSTGETSLLLDPKQNFNVDMDIEKPLLSPNEDYFFFTNKSDLSLWALKLVQ